MTVRINKPALNLREKLTELDKPSGIAGEAMLRAETPQEQFNLIGAGRKNLIINGGFDVSQRGDYSSATTIASGNYYLDRFRLVLGVDSTGTVQHTTETLPNNKTVKALKLVATATASSGYLGIRHILEDFKLLSNQTVTVSAWVKTNIAGYTFRHDSTTNFGDTFPATGNWEYVTATYTMPTITAAGPGNNQTTLAIINYTGVAGAGQNNGDFFQIAQLQLELGKVATPFEHRSYGEELALCQRYYQKITDFDSFKRALGIGVGASTDNIRTHIPTPVLLRATPTINLTGSLRINVSGVAKYYTSSAVSIVYNGGNGVSVNLNNGGTSISIDSAYYIFAGTVGTAFSFDAEL